MQKNLFHKKICKFPTLLLILILIFQPPIALANTNADALANNGVITTVPGLVPDGSTNTRIHRAANGTPIVDTATANSSRFSHNRFTRYNVTSENQVINNFQGSSSNLSINSNLGGVIYANPNLQHSGSANLILNEVTSDHASYINGYIEIAGGRADLMISNPNGLSLNGGGFLNVNRLSLVAGSMNLDEDGNVKGSIIGDKKLSPSNIAGQVIITARNVLGSDNSIIPLGLDAMDTTHSEIIARTVKISGEIYAKNLTIKTGNDKAQYDQNSKEFTVTSDADKSIDDPATDENGDITTLAIDSSYLGGMYAGRIKLVATEDGLGVRTRGNLIADVSNIDIKSAGNVEYSNIISKQGDVNIQTTNLNSINSNSMIDAVNDVNLDATETITNAGQIKAGNNLNVEAENIDNSGSLIAIKNLDLVITNDLNNQGNIYAINQIDINAATINNSITGLILADNILNIDVVDIANEGRIKGANELTFTNLASLSNDGASALIYSISDIVINLANLENINGATINSNTNITINASNQLTNDQSLILAIGNLNIEAASITNNNTNINILDSDGNIIFD
ncbi:MAG: filamentous hemagglutinin, partial [Lentimonas sp.]